MTAEQTQMVADLAARRTQNRATPKVNNADAPAGSVMVYYCKLCDSEVDRLSEEHTNLPRQHCHECQRMLDAGFAGDKFVTYDWVTCPSCGGSGLGVHDYYLKRRRKCSHCNGESTIRIVKNQ